MELLSAEVDWRLKTDAVVEAKKNAELVLITFRNLAGIPHSQTITLMQVITDMPVLPETPNLGSVLASRADYRSLFLARDLTDVDRRAAGNAFLPELSASFTYGLGGMIGNADVGNKDFNTSAFGLSLNIPIATGGLRLARMRAADIEKEKANIAIWQKETAIESELYELELRLNESRQRIESSNRIVETARRAVALAQAAYSNGQATYLTVVDAQDKLDQVWLNFANVVFEYMSAYYDWELAVGTK
jgi:outer membrane protein TolC